MTCIYDMYTLYLVCYASLIVILSKPSQTKTKALGDDPADGDINQRAAGKERRTLNATQCACGRLATSFITCEVKTVRKLLDEACDDSTSCL